jgi:hypothetical protein
MIGRANAIILLLALAACSAGIHHHVRETSYDGCADCSQTAKDLAWSLDNEKSEWSNNGFTICKSWNEPCVWYANGSRQIEAGNNQFGSGYRPNGDDRDLIWRAVQRWLRWDIASD